MPNNVQSLDKKRGRGRPRNKDMEVIRSLWSDNHSRSSLYDKRNSSHISVAARRLGLTTEHGNDVGTNRRMGTKEVEISRLFHHGFWETREGEEWLMKNWPTIVELSVQEVKEWVREHNPRAKR